VADEYVDKKVMAVRRRFKIKKASIDGEKMIKPYYLVSQESGRAARFRNRLVILDEQITHTHAI
jgi:hypothetical protein